MNIINYFAESLYVKIVLNSAEIAVLEVCYYCKNCKNCKRFYSIKTELEKKDFWTFSKYIKYWDIRDPEFNEINRDF